MTPIVLALDFNESPFPAATEVWITPDDLSGCAPPSPPVDLDSVCLVASQILRNLSGRRYGVRRITIRPYQVGDDSDIHCLVPWVLPDGSPVAALTLAGPARIIAVSIDGVVVDPSLYWLVGGRRLVFDATISALPAQNLRTPLGQPGTWSVTYESGTPVPQAASTACQVLACELVKLLIPAVGKCSITDARVTSVTRQGVTKTMLDPEVFKDGRTGLYIPDLWLASLVAAKKKRRAVIAGPETYMGGRV